MKNHLNALHGCAGYARFSEIGFEEGYVTVFEMGSDVTHSATGEVIDDVDFGATLNERVNEMRSDEGCAAGYENLLISPDNASLRV
jgi:hypothetical protein